MTIVQGLKANEERNTHLLTLIINDDDAKKLLVGWTLYRPRNKDRELGAGERLDMAAKKIWPRVDFERLSRLSGVAWRSALEIFPRLREAGLVYPDGTANEQALRIIRGEVGAHIQGLVKR